jgi:hypothetical protein
VRNNRTAAAQGATTASTWEYQALDLAALHQRVDIALSLRLFEAAFGRELRHKIVIALERGQVLLGELAPLRLDFLDDNLLGFGDGCGTHVGSNIGHLSVSVKYIQSLI